MRRIRSIGNAIVVLLAAAIVPASADSPADPGWAAEQRAVLAAIDRLGAATAPDGERTGSAAALAEVWIRSGDEWKLLLVNVHPLDGDEG